MNSLAMICRMDNVGLGTLSYEFARHLRPKKVLLVYNERNQPFPEKYADFDTRIARGPFTDEDVNWLFDGTRTLLTFETFYDWSIVRKARTRGVKTALMTMIEMTPARGYPMMPSLLLAPSKLDYDHFKDVANDIAFLPVPVNTQALQWRKRGVAKHFIHTGSHSGMSGRKGTKILLDAMRLVKSDIKLTVYTWGDYKSEDPRVEMKQVNFKHYWQLYREGDVLVYPQGANGICLPICEAMASGMGVITTDQFPFNEYMQKRLMFKPKGFTNRPVAGGLMPVADPIIYPEAIAEKIDEIAGTDLGEESEYGKRWAEENSWDTLLPDYQDVLLR